MIKKNNEKVTLTAQDDKAIPQLIPIFIRVKHAPIYCGMNKNRFREEVRPFLTTIKIGKKGIAFDRNELDKWAENIKRTQKTPIFRQFFNNIKESSSLGDSDSVKRIQKKQKIESDYQRAVTLSKNKSKKNTGNSNG